MRRLNFLILYLLYFIKITNSQNLNFTSEIYNWPHTLKSNESIPDSFIQAGAVILNDDVEVNFSNSYIKRTQSIKIIKEDGLNYFKTISLPQSFDVTQINNPMFKQGRFNKINFTFTKNFKITYFACRISRANKTTEIPLNITTKKVYYINPSGDRIFDDQYLFTFPDLDIGDILEYSYKAEIAQSYGNEQFYFQDCFPKINMHLAITVMAPKQMVNAPIIFNNNIDSAYFTRKLLTQNGNTYQMYDYQLKKLNAISYSQNVLAGKMLPHVTASGYSSNKLFFNSSLITTKYMYSTKYTWIFIPDSLSRKVKVYDKNGASLRKFLSKFSRSNSDSTKISLFSQITDSLNAFQFISAEEMNYSKDAKYALTSSERLLKRQITEEFLFDIYTNILFEEDLFYYKANIQDRRLGSHSTQYRAHENYELNFLALPVRKSFKLFVPNFRGLTYYPDELPFYYEGATCALFPQNTKVTKYVTGIHDLKFINTPLSTYNENIRIENGTFKVNTDSNLIHVTMKENLSGQFSTILRRYYDKEIIDSTIKLEYFKNCTEKPNSSNQKITKSNQLKVFPFKSTYHCSEQINISKNEINLSNWFSFLYKGENFNKPITQNYYLDFTFTDIYNFLFEFDKPITIKNIEEFNITLKNDYFEVVSSLTKRENNQYLLTCTTKAKQYLISINSTHLLIEYISLLDKLNNIKMQIQY